MDYNSSREELIIPEYGRNVQKLINHAKAIENAEERQAFAERIVGLMMQMHPQNRNLDDYRDKMWRHLFRIANFELDVMPPNGVIPTPETAYKKPDIIPYPKSTARFRHYGNNVQDLINKAIAMEEGPKKDGFAGVIGSYMKLAYRTWNKEHYISDEIIKNDLATLSEGALKMDDDVSIENLSVPSRKRSSKRNDNRGGHSHKGRHKNGRKKR